MRLLLFHTHCLGPTDDHLRALACNLSREGLEVHLLSPCSFVFPDAANVTIHPLEVEGRSLDHRLFSISILRQLVEVLQATRVDVVNAHGVFNAGMHAMLARELTRLPFRLVTTLHGTDLPCALWDGDTRFALRSALKGSDALTAVSSHVKTHLCQNLHLDPLPVQVIPPFLHAETSPVREGLPEPPVVLHVSNYRQMKRPRDALFVLKEVLAERRVTLLMVGNGPDRLACEGLAKHLGVETQVRFLAPTGNLTPILRQAQVLLLPAEHETSNLLALQALRLGVPIVASQAGSTPEVVLQRRTGTLHPVGDVHGMARGMIQVLSRWEQYHHEVRAFADTLDTDRLTLQYLQMYQHSLQGPVSPGSELLFHPGESWI